MDRPRVIWLRILLPILSLTLAGCNLSRIKVIQTLATDKVPIEHVDNVGKRCVDACVVMYLKLLDRRRSIPTASASHDIFEIHESHRSQTLSGKDYYHHDNYSISKWVPGYLPDVSAFIGSTESVTISINRAIYGNASVYNLGMPSIIAVRGTDPAECDQYRTADHTVIVTGLYYPQGVLTAERPWTVWVDDPDGEPNTEFYFTTTVDGFQWQSWICDSIAGELSSKSYVFLPKTFAENLKEYQTTYEWGYLKGKVDQLTDTDPLHLKD